MRAVFFCALTGLLLSTAGAFGDAAEPPPPPPGATTLPPVKAKPKGPAHEAAMTAAAERWKMKRALQRLKRRGAAGQHDLFWEILTLWEKQEKSRSDADLVKVMDWLLFEAKLWKDPDLASAAAKRIPNMVPALGQKLVVARLEEWVVRQASRHAGNAPWRWREFQGKNRKHLGTAAAQLLRSGPKHNPLTRIWMAAALLAGEGKGAEKEMASTWKLLHERLPARAPGVTRTVALSLASGGAKGGLKLLLDASQHELDSRAKAAKPVVGEVPPRGRPRRFAMPSRAWPVCLKNFHSLVGWMPLITREYTDSKAQAAVATSRKWLKANQAKLSWNPVTRKYQGGAPQPGMEKFFKAAAALKAKYGFDGVDQMVTRSIAPSGALLKLLSLTDTKPELVKDANLDPVVETLVRMSGDTVFSTYASTGTSILSRLSRLPKPLSTQMYAATLGTALRSTRQYSNSRLSMTAKADPELLAAACSRLKPDLGKEYQAALKGTDAGARLEAALRYLFVGGDVPQKKLGELVRNATAASYSKRAHVKSWMEHMVNAGMSRGLRVCLALAEAESASGGTASIRAFGKYAGWYRPNQYRFPEARTELAKALKWLPANESKLKWDKIARKFSGAPAPGAEDLIRNAAAIEKRWGIKVGDAASGGRDGARKLFSEIVALGLKKPAAGKDRDLMAALAAAIEIGDVKTDTLLKKKLLVDLPKFSPKLGGKYWASYVKGMLTGTGYRGSVSGLTDMMLQRSFPGYDRRVLPWVCKVLKPEMKKAWEDSTKDKTDVRIKKGLAYVAVGGTLDEVKFAALLTEAEKLGSTTRLGLHYWGPAIATLGNLDGLKLMLIYAQRSKHSSANRLGAYLYMVGKSKDRYGRDLFRMDKAKLAERVAAELKWLEANRKNLALDVKTGRYKLTGKEVKIPGNGGKKDPGPDIF